jgi:ABC-type transporter Mla subunit MlaD
VINVSRLISDVSSACHEQSAGVEQIATTVAQIDTLTQSNAANSEEAAAASQQLRSDIAVLRDVVDELAGVIGGSAEAGHADVSSICDVTYAASSATVRRAPTVHIVPKGEQPLPPRIDQIQRFRTSEFSRQTGPVTVSGNGLSNGRRN